MPRFPVEELRHIGSLLFAAAGAPQEIAAKVADSLVTSNLRGHDFHGIASVSGYVRRILAGELDPKARPTVLNESPTTALVDGQWAFGQITAEFATDVLVQKALEMRVAAVGVRNCNHIGRLGQYAEQAADSGVIAMVTLCGGGVGTSTTPYGGAARTLGTNPFAFGLPAGTHPPVIVDFATTVVAGGKIAAARDRGEPIPEGRILTKDGQPTTDPNEFAEGGMLLPMGEHKGFGLSMVAEALGGALTGATRFEAEQRSRNCLFVWGIEIGAFQPAEEYRMLEDRSIAKVKATPPAPGFDEVLIPGERGRRAQQAR
jgi:uncharacterized oxidoreductase